MLWHDICTDWMENTRRCLAHKQLWPIKVCSHSLHYPTANMSTKMYGPTLPYTVRHCPHSQSNTFATRWATACVEAWMITSNSFTNLPAGTDWSHWSLLEKSIAHRNVFTYCVRKEFVSFLVVYHQRPSGPNKKEWWQLLCSWEVWLGK